MTSAAALVDTSPEENSANGSLVKEGGGFSTLRGGEGLVCGEDNRQEYFDLREGFSYWCEGALMLPVGVVGLAGNLIAIAVLSSRLIQRSPFHYLLMVLAVCDILFLACSVPVHAIMVLQTDALIWLGNTWVFGRLFRFVLYPFSTVAYTGGVYVTISVTLERFVAVVFPFSYRDSMMRPNATRNRAIKFVAPALLAALFMNATTFLEFEVSHVNGTNHYKTTKLKRDPDWVYWNNLSAIIHPFLTTTVAPIVAICTMNIFIYRGIIKARKAVNNATAGSSSQQANGPAKQKGETNLAVVLVMISLVFVVTHIPHLILACETHRRADLIATCIRLHGVYNPPLPLACLESVGNLLVVANASSNFAVYCMTSTDFTVVVKRWLFGPAASSNHHNQDHSPEPPHHQPRGVSVRHQRNVAGGTGRLEAERQRQNGDSVSLMELPNSSSQRDKASNSRKTSLKRSRSFDRNSDPCEPLVATGEEEEGHPRLGEAEEEEKQRDFVAGAAAADPEKGGDEEDKPGQPVPILQRKMTASSGGSSGQGSEKRLAWFRQGSCCSGVGGCVNANSSSNSTSAGNGCCATVMESVV